jgi:hypothetical protein
MTEDILFNSKSFELPSYRCESGINWLEKRLEICLGAVPGCESLDSSFNWNKMLANVIVSSMHEGKNSLEFRCRLSSSIAPVRKVKDFS